MKDNLWDRLQRKQKEEIKIPKGRPAPSRHLLTGGVWGQTPSGGPRLHALPVFALGSRPKTTPHRTAAHRTEAHVWNLRGAPGRAARVTGTRALRTRQHRGPLPPRKPAPTPQALPTHSLSFPFKGTKPPEHPSSQALGLGPPLTQTLALRAPRPSPPEPALRFPPHRGRARAAAEPGAAPAWRSRHPDNLAPRPQRPVASILVPSNRATRRSSRIRGPSSSGTLCTAPATSHKARVFPALSPAFSTRSGQHLSSQCSTSSPGRPAGASVCA